MLAYKEIIRCVANTDKNFFLFNNTNQPIKNKIKNKIIKNKIIKKHIHINNTVTKKETSNDNIWIASILFRIMMPNLVDIKSKYKQYSDLLNNCLIIESEQNREKFTNLFNKIQKIYNIFNRLIYRYKQRKAKIVVNTDMYLNELIEGSENVISIIQNNSKYLFNIKDLINIIDTSLTNSSSFFAYPKNVKNPYNNMPFNKSTLYNIYFYIKFNTNYYSELLFKFFDCHFNITTFKITYEYLLREIIIRNYVLKSTANILLDEIKYMIESFNNLCKRDNNNKNKIIKIDEGFPKNRLIKIMKPYLFLFCKALYSYHPIDKKIFTYYFKEGLLRFNKYNPEFGKKECKLVYKIDEKFATHIVCETTFNEKHLTFNNIEKQNETFLTDHLTYSENTGLPQQVTNSDSDNDTTITQEDAVQLSDTESDSNSLS